MVVCTCALRACADGKYHPGETKDYAALYNASALKSYVSLTHVTPVVVPPSFLASSLPIVVSDLRLVACWCALLQPVCLVPPYLAHCFRTLSLFMPLLLIQGQRRSPDSVEYRAPRTRGWISARWCLRVSLSPEEVLHRVWAYVRGALPGARLLFPLQLPVLGGFVGALPLSCVWRP